MTHAFSKPLRFFARSSIVFFILYCILVVTDDWSLISRYWSTNWLDYLQTWFIYFLVYYLFFSVLFWVCALLWWLVAKFLRRPAK